MVVERLERSNFVDEAYAAIKRLIVSGQLGPGGQIKIEMLSRQLGVSNSPIREALRRLEHERWVETVPYRGAFVRPFDERELAELYEVREFLEIGALRKAMPALPRERLKELEQAGAAIRSALRQGDQGGYYAADTRFHQAIVDAADNRRLSELFATLAEQGKCFALGRDREAMSQHEEGGDEHGELVTLIRAGKTGDAVRLLKRHLRVSLKSIRKLRPTSQGGQR